MVALFNNKVATNKKKFLFYIFAEFKSSPPHTHAEQHDIKTNKKYIYIK